MDLVDGQVAVKIEPGSYLSQQGGEGGAPYSLMCSEGQAVVGLSVRHGTDAVERVTLRCASVEVEGNGLDVPVSLVLGPAVTTGSAGTQHHPDTHGGDCPAGQVATGHHGQQTANVCINGYGLTCQPIVLM
ncbi:MAG: hypothetical protein K0V04_19565 [Deltaproteobacteria bacterium]|nr:hypothetical protein [Deltaproteobacteria bacterium]